ncbi:hypothetical protein M413DRAFT_62833 [Hebeloma cylindrosporum]|uniref:Uncharacterized protein n=1 Tax=Hebeloma cylindrosporum TaxID=76867 RepID=A0A0C3CV67_HEBCY|nr:hypothetical protein M413DRAFT_62833 [Hebeloma cylindrosporum h7]
MSSDKNARTLSQPSNRARPREIREKKVVFKGVLDSPFRIHWPSVPLNLQNAILSHILQLLEGVSAYLSHRSAQNRKRKRNAILGEPTSQKKPRKTLNTGENASPHDRPSLEPINQKPTVEAAERVDFESPLILSHLLYGVNVVTKRLEIQTQRARRPTVISADISGQLLDPKPLKYIFVCRADVDPPLLIDHLPHLVAAYNSTNPSEYLKLIPLPQGSELALARALGIRKVTVLGIDTGFPDDPRLSSLLESVSTLSASWLSTPAPPLIATHIKHLRTTAPKDMKAARVLRTEEKAAAKEKKKKHLPKSSPLQ